MTLIYFLIFVFQFYFNVIIFISLTEEFAARNLKFYFFSVILFTISNIFLAEDPGPYIEEMVRPT